MVFGFFIQCWDRTVCLCVLDVLPEGVVVGLYEDDDDGYVTSCHARRYHRHHHLDTRHAWICGAMWLDPFFDTTF